MLSLWHLNTIKYASTIIQQIMFFNVRCCWSWLIFVEASFVGYVLEWIVSLDKDCVRITRGFMLRSKTNSTNATDQVHFKHEQPQLLTESHRRAARLCLRGGAEVMEAKALTRKNCL